MCASKSALFALVSAAILLPAVASDGQSQQRVERLVQSRRYNDETIGRAFVGSSDRTVRHVAEHLATCFPGRSTGLAIEDFE